MTTHIEDAARRVPSIAHDLRQASPERMRDVVLLSLEDSKAENTASIDIRGKSPLCDFMVVASGRSHRHVGAIADHLLKDLKDAGLGSAKVEGLPHCDWVLVDIGDVVVHIFRPEVRDFYNLEKMWMSDQEPRVLA